MENIVQKAIAKALEVHKGQVRKVDGVTPYVVHPLDVGCLIARFTDDQEIIAAAILHDTVEDGDYTLETLKEELGEGVRTLVDALTDDASISDWAERKQALIEKVSLNQAALVIKAADCLSNMRDLCGCIGKYGDSVWKKFNAPKGMKMQYFQLILQRSKQHLPINLLTEYVSTLKDLEYASQANISGAIGFNAA